MPNRLKIAAINGIRYKERRIQDATLDQQLDMREYAAALRADVATLRAAFISLLEKLDSEGPPLAGDYEETLTPPTLTADVEPAGLKVVRSKPMPEEM